MIQLKDQTQFYYHIVKSNSVILSNLPKNLLPEVNDSLAEAKLLKCKIRRIEKRQKKLPIEDGFVYLCTYDPSVTKNEFKQYFDILLLLIPAFEDAVKCAASPSFDLVKKIRHNVYDQLSHILDDMKFISAIEDIPSKDWNDIRDYSRDKILSNPEEAAAGVLRAIKRTAIALSEFDAYERLSSSTGPELKPHAIHKVVKLSLQPYLFDFWNNKVKINFGESYDKVLIDYELINLALGHFWNNATKYVSPGSEITISFSPYGKDMITFTITMYSMAISRDETERIFEIGESGLYAKKAKLDGSGIGMYYIKECVNRSNCSFQVTPGDKLTAINGKFYASNAFRFLLPKV